MKPLHKVMELIHRLKSFSTKSWAPPQGYEASPQGYELLHRELGFNKYFFILIGLNDEECGSLLIDQYTRHT